MRYLGLVRGVGILVLPLSPLRSTRCQRVFSAARADRSSPEYVHEPLHRTKRFLRERKSVHVAEHRFGRSVDLGVLLHLARGKLVGLCYSRYEIHALVSYT